MTWLRFPLVAVALLAGFIIPRSAAAQVAELQVTPDRLTLKLGEKRKLLPVAFDARGFVSPAIAPAARVGVHSPTGRANTPRGVVILASGLACPESTPFQCARM